MTLRFGAFVGALLVFSALLKNTQAQPNSPCTNITFQTTTTNVSIESGSDCNFTIGTNSYENNLITGLTPGAVYVVSVLCLNCSEQVTTKPEKVTLLTVTSSTNSSITLTWTKPVGNSSFYRVRWTGGATPGSKDVSETSMTINDLTAGVQYTITVAAVADDNITEGENDTVSNYTKPGIVRDLNVSNITTSSVFVSWNKPEGSSSSYRVQWTVGNVTWNTTETETFKNITDLTAGVQYKITVTAVADDGVTKGASVSESRYTKPGIVRDLNVSNITTSSVYVSWNKPEGSSSSYRVQWTVGNVTWNTTETETFKNITNLTAGVQYKITVTAVADDGVTKGASVSEFRYTKPAAVRDLSVTEITTSSLNLNWTEPVGSRYFYIVQWTDGTTIETVTETKLNVSKLTPGVRYSFTVIAVAGDNETKSEKAEIWHYTKPEVVNNLTVTEITTSSIHLNWTAPQGDRSFYVVQWTNGTTIQSVTETKLNVTGLTPGVYYNFNVIAVAGDNETKSEKAETSHYTKPGVIQNHNVTTDNSSISLNWTAPPGRVFKYRVELSNGSSLYTERTNNTFVLLSSLTPGTSYNVTVTAIAGDNKTEGEPFNVTVSTHPAVVINLTVTDVTTTSVSLSWSKPEGNADLYIIRCEGTKEMNSSNETFTIRDLTPGVKYSISVAAVAYSKEGVKAFTSTFTTPKKPVNITAVRGTNKLNISWILPLGRADRYVVEISNTDFMNSNSTNATVTNVLFTDLYPGRIFVIKVTAVAGNLNSTSDPSPIATVPNPPGSIVLVRRTNSSLQLQWTTPAMMEGAPNISYYITYKFINQFERDTIQNETSLNNSTELSPLLSGTSYNIFVQTVGPQNLRSTFVNISNFTLPNPVLNVKASPSSTSSVTVTWSYPVGVRSYYEYVVEVYNPTGGLVNTTISMTNSTIISQLEPGSEYNVSVTTRAAQGITSTAEQTSSYTMPKAVTNITVNYRNTTSIQLTWLRQDDYKSSYRYRVSALLNGIEVHNGSTSNETYTFYPLVPGTQYEFTVFTVVEEVKSTEQKLRSQTIPEATSDIVVIGSTTNLTVKWNPVNGRVDSYSVLLYRDMQQVDNATDLSNNTLIYVFTSLKPGVLYCAEVVTKSGPLESNHSDCNATFPNPPGPITVESQTVRSINFTWTRPENMDRNQYNFSVSTNKSTFVTANNWFLRDSLSSGQPYSISVVTVGVRNYKSTPVTARNYTQPHPASNLTHTKVTTGNVTLLWDQRESRPDYTYLVQVINGSQNIIRTEVVNEAKVSITGLLSGSNFSFTVTTRAADGTAASPETANFFTLPHMVRDLNAETLNTTAIKLSWKEPLEYKPYYRYWVRTAGCASQNTVLQENTTLISELSKEISKLTPGTNCSLCVSVVVADLITGEEKCTFQYTWPETAQLQISSKGSNSSVVVSWTHPIGNVEYYVVLLKHPNGTEDQRRRSNNSTEEMFDNLSAGRLYNATITTFSGPFNASSSFVTNATYPNPPGAITIQMKTINAIDFKWGEAPLMSGASFSYQMTNTPAYGATNATNVTTAPSNITNHTFSSLDSGTSYNITVATVGVLGYQSERVYIYLVTTRPLSVESLMSQAEEMNILVSWSRPDDYKESYRYFVTWESSDTNIRRNTTCTSCTDYNITDLEPGSHYNISVTTETSDGTRAATMPISNCTKASRVTILNVTCPDKEIAEITLNWTKPRGRFFEFKVMAKPENQLSIINNSSETRHTFSNLAHHTNYSLTVVTLSCGNPSAPVTTSCQTGITNPLIPAVFENPVVKVKLHNQFTLQINSELLNNSRGPIEAVGVLVKRQTDVNSSLIQHLRNTYEEWTAGRTKVYLATVTKNFTPLSRSTQPFHFDIQVGTGSKVENYFNGPLTPREHYQAAVMVSTRLIYTNGLVDISQSFVAITGFVDIGVLPPDPVIVPIAVGVTLGIFFILSIILIGFIIYWKRLSNKESSDIQIHSMRAKVSVAVTVEDFEAYYKKQKADSNCGFAEEFEDLKIVGTGQAKIHALDLENKPKNRYNNVLPYDSSRVKLSIIHGSPFDDYINANYMPGYNSRKEYIAAQGPLPTTVNDFWRMIWEKNVQTLVMLTRCNEQGRVKCEQYWSSGTKHFEDITVTTTSEIPLEDWTIRDFDIKYVKTAETRSVRHFHFTAWPDHGVPETTELLISFRHLVREHMNQYSRHSPTVVHCSAGVGRTGTFIAIDRLIFQIERENIVDVYGIVHDLRMHRPLMVQTEDQYVFLNQCALDVIRSRTGTNVDLIYQNAAALSIYENVEPKRGFHKNGYHNA